MNKDLKGNEYTVPSHILTHLSNCISQGKFNGEDVTRAQNIINTGKISYQNLSKIQSDMNSVDDPTRYKLWGGDVMKTYITSLLGGEINRIQNDKKTAEYAHNTLGINGMVKNPHNKTHEKGNNFKVDVGSFNKSNSDRTSVSGLMIPTLTEEINRIKKLMS